MVDVKLRSLISRLRVRLRLLLELGLYVLYFTPLLPRGVIEYGEGIREE